MTGHHTWLVGLRCNRCSREVLAEHSHTAQAEARRQGWKIAEDRGALDEDLCPGCAKESTR